MTALPSTSVSYLQFTCQRLQTNCQDPNKGCMFVHGIEGNAIGPYYPFLGLKTAPTARRFPVFPPCDPAHALPEEIGLNILTRVWKLVDEATKFAKQNPEQPISFLDYARSQPWFLDGLPEDSVERSVATGMLEAVASFEAAPLNDLSITMFATENERHGTDMFVSRGYDNLLRAMLKESDFDYNRIKLNKRAVSVRHSARKVKIAFADGTHAHADFLICTLPLGVLKHEKDLFQPELPLSLRSSINAMGYGTLDKIILRFPTKWWPQEDFATFLPDDALGTQDCPSIDKFHLLSFFSVSAYHEKEPSYPPVLAAWTSTDFAERIETLSDSDVSEIVMRQLRTTFPQISIPDPESIIVTRWHSDPHSRGSYSYLSMAMGPRSEAITHLKRLAEPVGRIHWAGEHTSRGSFSYQHGALTSGWSAAEEIIRDWGLEKPDAEMEVGCCGLF